MRKALFAASLALVAGTTMACGGSDGSSDDAPDSAPEAASVEEFCGAFDEFITTVAGMSGADTSVQLEALKDFASEWEDIGTPEDISDDARAGWELTVDAIQDLPDDATQEDLAAVEEDFSEEQDKQADAFEEYLTETCPGPSEAP